MKIQKMQPNNNLISFSDFCDSKSNYHENKGNPEGSCKKDLLSFTHLK
jgi:hypothetical protein